MADEILPEVADPAFPPPEMLWPAKTEIFPNGMLVLIHAGGAHSTCPLDAQQTAETHQVGRYTLYEAAAGLAESTGVDAPRWLETLTHAIRAGALPLRNPRNLRDFLPYTPGEIRPWHDQIFADDLNKWLATEYPGKCRFKPPVPSRRDSPEAESAIPANWITEAWNIGSQWMVAEEGKTKKRPGVTAIAKYVEGEFILRDIRGARGKYLDWETIKREALKGITGRKPTGRQ